MRAAGAVPGWDSHVHLFDAAQPVRGGHYRPGNATLADLVRTAQPSGLGRFVLVQPSVYGSDNRLVLDTLAATGGMHRAVVVVDHVPDDATLAAWHALGVRGIRLNLFSPVGDRERDWAALAPRLAAAIAGAGWHLQWYAQPDDLPQLAALQAACPTPFVLDHYGSLGPQAMADLRLEAAWARLADGGAWVKLSAPYRVRQSSSADLWRAHVARTADRFGPRCVWGSDWPHTAFAPDAAPAYAALVDDVAGALGAAAFAALVTENAERLYA